MATRACCFVPLFHVCLFMVFLTLSGSVKVAPRLVRVLRILTYLVMVSGE